MAQSGFIGDFERLRALAPVTAAPLSHHVFVCTGKSCLARDSAAVLEAFEHELKQRGILFGKEAKGKNPHGSIIVTECASVGFCSIGPTVLIYPDGVWYAQVQPKDIAEIIEEHLVNGRVVERLALMRLPSAPDSTNDQPANGGNWEV
ncbi:MAG TPA: (2Fe-2S) ferredoxin domain-containing protein [Pyrinomonadaceae bacterium]|nr:(2Fe-2S) ferredoxin domain-containing protein [Pyrinomonadaceae bacterium]